jgi:anti-sigma B factor antagonist
MGATSGFATRTEARNGVARIAVTGELDMFTVPILTRELTQAEQNGTSAILLDLRHVSFVDSSGRRAFVQARDRAAMNGRRLVLIGVGPGTRRLLELTQTEFLLDEQEAVSLLNQFTGRGRLADPDGSMDDDA